MLIYRLEHKKSGLGIFLGRHESDVKPRITELINDLAIEHKGPYSEDIGSSYEERNRCPLRTFEDAVIYQKETCHFAFTEYAFQNIKLAKKIVKLVKENEDIVLRKIENSEIVWVARSGVQVVFLDREKPAKIINKRQ